MRNRLKVLGSLSLIVLAPLILSGCMRAFYSQVVLPSGSKGYSLNCSGTLKTWAQCYEEAGKLCPYGYKIVEQEGQKPGTMVGANPSALFATPIVDRTMLVQCKAQQPAGASSSE